MCARSSSLHRANTQLNLHKLLSRVDGKEPVIFKPRRGVGAERYFDSVVVVVVTPSLEDQRGEIESDEQSRQNAVITSSPKV